MASLSSDTVTDISANLPSNKIADISVNLPSDMITDILSRLPVKSLMRFTCVSKYWYRLLTNNQSFIKMHLNRAAQNNPNLILKLDSKLFNVDHDWDEARRLELPFASPLEKIELSGSCNGLLCISDQICNEDVFLYNPSTRQYKKLPEVEFEVPAIETSCFTTLGFGYLPAGDDYKVVTIVYLYDKPSVNIDSYECEARVYSLSTDSWRKMGDVPFHISSRASVWIGNNGSLVWKASRGFGLTMAVLIVCLDMVEEKFMEIPQPPDLKDENSHIELGVFGGCLAIFHQSYDQWVEVWSMKEYGVKESWTRLYVIGRPTITDDHFRYLRPLWALKSGEILIEKSERVMVLYDPENTRFRDVTIRRSPGRFAATTYVGSLVSPFTCLDESAIARLGNIDGADG